MNEILQPLDLRLFLAGILFVFLGYAVAPFIYHKKIKWVVSYPLWIAEKLKVWSERDWNAYLLFLFIFCLNTISLSVSFYSGKFLFLPILFAVWTGLNVGIITFHTLEGSYYFLALLNPVAILELPAMFVAFALALGYNAQLLHMGVVPVPLDFSIYMRTFLLLVLPLLFIAGVIETALIKWTQKLEKK